MGIASSSNDSQAVTETKKKKLPSSEVESLLRDDNADNSLAQGGILSQTPPEQELEEVLMTDSSKHVPRLTAAQKAAETRKKNLEKILQHETVEASLKCAQENAELLRTLVGQAGTFIRQLQLVNTNFLRFCVKGAKKSYLNILWIY